MSVVTLRQLASARIVDAEVLHTHGRDDGAVYLCGYAVEFLLKARICDHLGWGQYPTGRGYESFRTHELPILLQLSGRSNLYVLGSSFAADWDVVLQLWSSQLRCEPVGTMRSVDAVSIIDAVKRLEQEL